MAANVEKTPDVALNRRDFLATTAAVGGAMVLGFHLPPTSAQAAPVEGQPWYRDAMVPELNAWLTIAPDDTVTIRVAQTEMGTGVFTSCPMMVAEELQCDWSKVRAEYASPRRNAVERAPEWTLQIPGGGNPLSRDGGGEPAQGGSSTGVYRRMNTSSSGSVRESRYYLQMAGAEARERLLLAAAAMWKVPTSELAAKNSVINHPPTGRRTTYGAVAARAAQTPLPDPSTIRIKGPDQFTLIGTEQKNLDVPLKVTGKAIYGIDVELPGMLYAAAKACPVFGGTVRSYDFNAIKDRPGVHSAVKFGGKGYVSGGVAVVADTWWRAKTALDLMPIEWDLGAGAHRNSAEMWQADFESMKQAGTTVLEEGGSYAAAKGNAAKVVEATYTVPYLAHARMEPGNATAMVTPGRVDVWTGDQAPDGALSRAAQEAGVTPDQVFIHTTFLGGGFGGGGASDQVRQAVAVAKTLNGRPVKLIWAREEDMRLGEKYRPMGIGRFEAALDADGWPLAITMCTTGDRYDNAGTPAGTYKNPVAEQAVRGLHELPYFVPILSYDVRTLNSHVPVGHRRATGSGVNVFYLESFIDELAHAAGKDSYEYRRELVARNTKFRDREDWLTALDRVAKMSGWGKPLPEGWARGIAVDDRRRPSRATVALCAEVVTVSISRRGQLRLERVDCVFDEGFSFVNPLSVRKQIEGQIAWAFSDVMWQEITVEDGRVVEGNFDQFRVARMADYPPVVNIQFLKTDNKWISGVGEEAIPQIAPAMAQAVFKITGKRIRSLPLGKQDLSWA
ncbi:MAG: isoquinoline 1-oxidoreductase subunit beta [Alphaproteobacteria bacterium]|jgi:isoquinoline 1-oxidoreductase beta subunit|nr:isoquinoline 1-oxidoreductase subunit beta [Alphaproteobacteria bacterium]